jgi:hypothetical protein
MPDMFPTEETDGWLVMYQPAPRHSWLWASAVAGLALLVAATGFVVFLVVVVAPSAGAAGGCGGG